MWLWRSILLSDSLGYVGKLSLSCLSVKLITTLGLGASVLDLRTHRLSLVGSLAWIIASWLLHTAIRAANGREGLGLGILIMSLTFTSVDHLNISLESGKFTLSCSHDY